MRKGGHLEITFFAVNSAPEVISLFLWPDSVLVSGRADKLPGVLEVMWRCLVALVACHLPRCVGWNPPCCVSPSALAAVPAMLRMDEPCLNSTAGLSAGAGLTLHTLWFPQLTLQQALALLRVSLRGEDAGCWGGWEEMSVLQSRLCILFWKCMCCIAFVSLPPPAVGTEISEELWKRSVINRAVSPPQLVSAASKKPLRTRIVCPFESTSWMASGGHLVTTEPTGQRVAFC